MLVENCHKILSEKTPVKKGRKKTVIKNKEIVLHKKFSVVKDLCKKISHFFKQYFILLTC